MLRARSTAATTGVVPGVRIESRSKRSAFWELDSLPLLLARPTRLRHQCGGDATQPVRGV
jgi:hypothetical protein